MVEKEGVSTSVLLFTVLANWQFLVWRCVLVGFSTYSYTPPIGKLHFVLLFDLTFGPPFAVSAAFYHLFLRQKMTIIFRKPHRQMRPNLHNFTCVNNLS